MMDEAEVLTRKAAYIDTLRALGRRERSIGYIACLVGVVVLVLARFRLGAPPWAMWTGVAIVAAGWGLFVYALIRRAQFVRSHPFDIGG